jgi:D-alanyl-D-alanine dipeptidase
LPGTTSNSRRPAPARRASVLPLSPARAASRALSLALALAGTAACGAVDDPIARDNGGARSLGPAVALAQHAAAFPWAGLIADYEANGDTVIVRERANRLEAIHRETIYLLEPASPASFVLLGDGRRDGAEVIFETDDDGLVDVAFIDGVAHRRLRYGAEGGETFRIRPVRPVEDLRREATAALPPVEDGDFLTPDLVDLATLDPAIRFDIRYATTNNFMGATFYAEPRAFLQRPAAEALLRAHRRLRADGFGLLVFDAYRPWFVTWMFFHATPREQRMFVANPALGSRHNRGAAVDVALYDLATGEPVPMPSGYDEFSPRAFPDYPGGTSEQRRNRQRLRHAMEAEGFAVYYAEWWHFDYRDWRRYPILNLTFEQLDR